MTEIFIGHHRKQGSTIVTDTLTNCPGKLVIAPRARPSLRVRSKIRRRDHQISLVNHDAPRSFLLKNWSDACLGFLLRQLRVAIEAPSNSFNQVLASRHALWSALNFPICQRPGFGAQYRPPTHGDSDQNHHGRHNSRESPSGGFLGFTRKSGCHRSPHVADLVPGDWPFVAASWFALHLLTREARRNRLSRVGRAC